VGELGSLVIISTASVYLVQNVTWLDAAPADDDFPRLAVPVTEQHPIVTAEVEGYSPQKAALERALWAIDGLPVTIMRPGAIHGPGSPALREWYFIKRALDGRRQVPLVDAGASRFATSATVVIAELVRLAAEHPARRVLNAVDEPTPSVLEIGQAVFAHLGHEAEFVAVDRGPEDTVGYTPWSVPVPVVLSMQAAVDELGYVPLGSHRDTIGPAIDSMLAAVAEADWRERFPGLTRYGAEEWFDYAAEDELLGA
jgi:nucleoside-diphosphate-sugar epimerase